MVVQARSAKKYWIGIKERQAENMPVFFAFYAGILFGNLLIIKPRIHDSIYGLPRHYIVDDGKQLFCYIRVSAKIFCSGDN